MVAEEVINGLSELVSRGVPEEEVQSYIETHPWLVTGEHYPDSNIVISKLPLGAEYCTDFAYFWGQSGGNYLQLVEIKKPDMQVFTGDDEFTSGFNHALQQLADWEDWCGRRQDAIRDLIQPLCDAGAMPRVPSRAIVRTALIAGRRSEVLANSLRQRRWEQKVNESRRVIRTWDGLIESLPTGQRYYGSMLGDIRCVRYRKQGFAEL